MICFLLLIIGCNSTESDEKTPLDTTSAPSATEATSKTTGEDPEKKDPDPVSLDGKKIIFIGNSYTYYGKTVLEKKQTYLTQASRSNVKGFFYQLCKENGANVEVTNWTFGAHDFTDLFKNCTANRGCDGVDHASYLVDRNFDYYQKILYLQQCYHKLPCRISVRK